MEHWELRERWARGAAWAAGLGALAGAGESVLLAATSRLPTSWIEAFAVGVLDAAALGVAAAAVGVLAGVVHLRADVPSHRNLALQLALVAGALGVGLLSPLAARLWAEGRPGAAAAAVGMAVGGGGAVLFNARYWLARAELGRPAPVGWLPAVGLATAAVTAIAAALAASRDTGGRGALEGDPNVLLVTVDGWDRAATGPYGGPTTPALDALAARGAVFETAISPVPSSLAAHASLLTGLHPLRHQALSDQHTLPAGLPTVATRLTAEGWATAGFVSTAIVGGDAGLDQGFRVFDDALEPGPRGLSRARLPGLAMRALGFARAVRSGAETVGAFEAWLGGHAAWPWMAWVHLPGPDRASGENVDALLGRLVAAVQGAGVTERTLVIAVGATGPTGRAPFSDARTRVPLVIAAPGHTVRRPRVSAQVRLVDIPQTIARYAGLDPLAKVEGVDLLNYLDGSAERPLWTSLVAWDGEGWSLGVRSEGVLYVADRGDGEALYDLSSDPEATRDLAAGQPEAVARARDLLVGEEAALDRRLREGPPPPRRDAAWIDALGAR